MQWSNKLLQANDSIWSASRSHPHKDQGPNPCGLGKYCQSRASSEDRGIVSGARPIPCLSKYQTPSQTKFINFVPSPHQKWFFTPDLSTELLERWIFALINDDTFILDVIIELLCHYLNRYSTPITKEARMLDILPNCDTFTNSLLKMEGPGHALFQKLYSDYPF